MTASVHTLKTLTVALAAFFLVGCSGDRGKSFEELRAIAVECQKGSLKAREEKDAGEARKQADRAAKVVKTAEKKLAALEEPSDEETRLVDEIAAAARQADATANLAQEDADLAKQLTGWKAKSYSGTRKLLLKGVFLGLSYSATKVDEKGLESLPKKVRGSAELGADLVYQYTSLEKTDDEEHDWGRIAEELKAMAGTPPDEIAAMLAATYLMGAQKDLAIYEIESLDLEQISDSDRKLIYQIIRAVILSSNGYKGLAVEQMETAIKEHANAETEEGNASPTEMLGMVHLGLAAFHIKEKRYAEADKEAVNGMKVWPNNPLSVFLTGELLLGEGKREEAAKSLEAAAAGSEYEWLAEAISERAKEIRDGKDDSESLVYNARAIGKLVTLTMIEKAKDSETAQRLKEWADTRKSFGDYFDETKARILSKRKEKHGPEQGDISPEE